MGLAISSIEAFDTPGEFGAGEDLRTASAAAGALDPREFAQHRPQLLKHARWVLRNSAAAEDAVQETMLAALQASASFSGRSSVRTWLFGILKHKLADTLRRGSREVPLEVEATPELYTDDGHLQRPPTNWGDPEASFAQQRFFEVLEECMDKLPGTLARVFTMREVLGMETAQICETLNISSNNCFVMLHRARMTLRGLLEEHWFGESQVRH